MESVELIEKYVLGKLSSPEKTEFDRRMAEDSSFAEEVKFHENLSRVIAAEQTNIQKEKLVALEAEFEQAFGEYRVTPTSNYARIGKWLIAASFLIIAGLAGWFFTQKNGLPSDDKLVAQYFEPYRNVIMPVERNGNNSGIGDPSNQVMIDAFNAYEQGDFETALSIFNKTADENGIPPYLYFYRGICHLELDNSSAALEQFQRYNATDGDERIAEQIYWYTALALLHQKEYDKAIAQLEPLTLNQGGFKVQEAVKLSKTLKKKVSKKK